MRRLSHVALWVALSLCAAARAAAQDEAPLSVRLWPDGAAEGAAARYRFVLQLEARGARPVEVVADRRLLELSVLPEGSRRAVSCRHPDAPRRAPGGRIRLMGGTAPSIHREWLDVREQCWGRALDAFDRGGELRVAYGFRRPGRGRFVARAAEGGAALAHRVQAEPLQIPARVVALRDAPAPLEVTLARADVPVGSAPTFRASLRARAAPVRVYPRDDLWAFRVDGPLGAVVCELPRQPIVPIIDFYRRVGRRSAPTSISSALACPEGTFSVPGVYDVTPVVDLVYDGARYELEVLTGRFEGASAPVRVRAAGAPYVEQVLDREPVGEHPASGGAS